MKTAAIKKKKAVTKTALKYTTDLSKAKQFQKFSARISGYEVSGILYKSEASASWFMLHSNPNRAGGKPDASSFGYPYGYNLGDGSKGELKSWGVSKLILGSVDKSIKEAPKAKVINISDRYTAFVYDNYIKVGCQSIEFDTIKKVYTTMLKLRKNEKA